MIDPGQRVNVPLQITAAKRGQLEAELTVDIAGSTDVIRCHMVAKGVGPYVFVDSTHIEFGSIPVLQDAVRGFKITNNSLIPAELTIQFVKDQTIWSVDQPTLVLEPKSARVLQVTANLDDAIEFTDKMLVLANNGNEQEISLHALGTGTTIVTEPSMNPIPKNGIDLGSRFTTQDISKEIKFINRGRRHQKLSWSVAGFERLSTRMMNDLKGYEDRVQSKDVKFKNLAPPEMPLRSIFSFSDTEFELDPGQSTIINLNGRCDVAKCVKETLVCSAEIGRPPCGRGRSQRIMQVPVQCQFIHPLINASADKLHFKVDKQLDSDLEIAKRTLMLENVSSLSLRIQLRTKYPFGIQSADRQSFDIVLKRNDKVEFDIYFEPKYREDFICRRLADELIIDFLDHPSSDIVSLSAEVNFPNLEFSLSDIDFGTILNNTESAVTVNIRNNSPLDVQFRWWFEVPSDGGVQRNTAKVKSISDSESDSFSKSTTESDLTIDKVFDILPLFGQVRPGEEISATISFNGHSNLAAQCLAVCEVDQGPQYEINVQGQSSSLTFEFSETNINYEQVMFDSICEKEITLFNSGAVGFPFSADDLVVPTTQDFLPGVICVTPKSGFLGPYSRTSLKVSYLPGVPQFFRKSFAVKIAHFKPIECVIMGEGVFPRISLDLPRSNGVDKCDHDFYRIVDLVSNEMQENSIGPVSDIELEMEAERIIMVEAAKSVPERNILRVNKASRFHLPDYILDFGPVILGDVRSHTVKATNTGILPVSFSLDHSSLLQSGFMCELDRVKSLPGYPRHETVEFKFTFDPGFASLDIGIHEVRVPINIVQGPTITMIVRADVTMPRIEVSSSKIDFGSIECGRSKVVSLQLFNPLDVDAVWKYKKTADKRFELDKHMPLHLRRQIRKTQKPLPRVFEIAPFEGILAPKQRATIQLRFMPMGDGNYDEKLTLVVADSTQEIDIETCGVGTEPKLEIDHNIVELGPVLPFATGRTFDLKIKNPSLVPLEFYSSDFDEQYLEEEKILRNQKGFDKFGNLMLPPRLPGQSLPSELLQNHFEEGMADNEGEKTDEERSLPDKHDPVQLAVARHLGIDLSPEGKAARNRMGISLIVYGAPFSGKTTIANQVAVYYDAVILTIDDIIINSILNGTSAAAKTARELCHEESMRRQAEICRESEMMENQDQIPLKDDAISSKTATTPNKSAKGSVAGSKAAGSRAVKGQGSFTEPNAHAPMLPQRTIGCCETSNSSLSTDNADLLLTCLLPEELIAEIIGERLQKSDCFRGVIIDGLESCFLSNLTSSLQTVLKGFNNRKYINIINTKMTYNQYEIRTIDASRKAAIEKVENDRQELENLLNMAEEEYDLLSDTEKDRIDGIR